MKGLENNLKFEYLYRDAGNYKQFGSVVLSNPNGITVEIATNNIITNLIDGEFFSADKVQVPSLHNTKYDPSMDHDWYEFEKVSITDEVSTESLTIQDFIQRFA